MCEHDLQLMENVIIELFCAFLSECYWLSIVCHEDEAAEGLRHE
jgi:hypothetical protein